MTMSPGPNTIRKVSRFRAHLDFTTRPRTGTTSVSKPAAGSITNLLFIDASPLPPEWGHDGHNGVRFHGGGRIPINTRWRFRKGRSFEPWESERRASAFRVHHRYICGRCGGEGDSLKTIGLPPELPRRVSLTGRLIVVRFHIPFWRRVRSSGGKQKRPFPPSGRNGQLSRTIADGFPHWSKLQHRAP